MTNNNYYCKKCKENKSFSWIYCEDCKCVMNSIQLDYMYSTHVDRMYGYCNIFNYKNFTKVLSKYTDKHLIDKMKG